MKDRKKYFEEYRKKNANIIAVKKKKYYGKYHSIRINTFLSIYGNKCAKCGESNTIFLTLNRINPTSRKAFPRWKEYQTAIEHYDPNEYEILCYNCNLGNKITLRRTGTNKKAKYRHRARERFLEMYGNKCICCGETNSDLLTMDHINNDGGIKRKERNKFNNTKEFIKAIQLYDPETYQILCLNCNLGKQRNGGICPHKEIKSD